MTTRLARLMGVLLALLLIIAACGDDEATTTETNAEGPEGQPAEVDSAEGDAQAEPADDGMADEGMADDGMGEDMAHEHGDGLEVPEGMAIPEISIELLADPIAGQNLAVSLQNFTITPENASTEPVDGEGHLHLYVDGERTARFYNEWMHLMLEPGEHTVEVEVSANNHSAYAVDGVPIRALATIDVPAAGEHHHPSGEMVETDAASAPAVTVEVFEDPKKGWNIHAEVENFVIAPEHASTDHVDGEGHFHLWVDGEKVTRLYGNWWHLAELTEGEHEIMVEVSANDHSGYAVAGEPIVGTTTVVVSADQATSSDMTMGSGDEHEAEMDMEMIDNADVTIDIVFADGAVTIEDDRIEVERDALVVLVVESDVDEHIHVHGYDIFGQVGAGETTTLGFTADVPGVFEVELEDSVTFVTELIVE